MAEIQSDKLRRIKIKDRIDKLDILIKFGKGGLDKKELQQRMDALKLLLKTIPR